MKQNLLKTWLTMFVLLILGGSSAWATTYRLQQVSSVSAGEKYVFVQDTHAFGSTVSSSALQTVTGYNTTGLAGTEAYVWTLETANEGFYMKNVSLNSNQYLKNGSGTGISFCSSNQTPSVWAFDFTNQNAVLIQNKNNDNRFLGYTAATSYVYKAYATQNLSNYPHAIKVYKLVDESLGGTKYTVTFNGNGHGTPASASLTEASAGAGVTLPGCTPDAGYVFKGWGNAADAATANIGAAGAKYTPTANVTAYALYNSTHTVNIVSPVGGTLTVKKGAVEVNDGDVLENGTTLTIEATADDGYEYRNWQYKAGDAAWATRTSTYTYTIDGEDVTFRANFDRLSTADVTLDFTDNSTWQFPAGSANKTVDEDIFSDGTYDVIIAGSTGNGYYFNSDGYLMLGKQDAYLTLPAFPFAVEKIIVYGNSGASSTVGQNIYVGDVAVSTATVGAKTSNTYEIAEAYQAAGNEYTLKVTTAANTQITSIEIYKKSLTISLNPDCTDGSLVYGTYSNSSAWEVTDDIDVSEIGVIDGELVVEKYTTGDVVPANTGVMVSSLTGGDFRVPVSTGGTSKLGNNNCLRPTGAGITSAAMGAADANSEFFRLTMHNRTQIGFWWGAEDGAAFNLGANKAYLAVSTDNLGLGAGARLWFGDDETAIKAVKSESTNAAIYNLAGQRISKMQKGINIVNGKKVLK